MTTHPTPRRKHPMTDTPLTQLLREGAETFLRLVRTLGQAEAIQWDAAPVPRPQGDARRAIGGHGDPTADTALDGRRLAVRDAIRQARRAIRDLLAALRYLEQALDRYYGD